LVFVLVSASILAKLPAMDALSALAPAVARALVYYQRSLQQSFPNRLQELVLYGSQARGTTHEESDVDVLVVIDDLSEAERRAAIDLAYDANAVERESWAGLSPLVYSTAQASDLRARERLIMRNIDADGMWLHGSHPPSHSEGLP
jgi:hypothetical protein